MVVPLMVAERMPNEAMPLPPVNVTAPEAETVPVRTPLLTLISPAAFTPAM